ncbi:MAG TPA: ECF-type sigma factor [Gemmatales bacterium]|nr:ECF-type sigma factor [Gemmatales bacterium]
MPASDSVRDPFRTVYDELKKLAAHQLATERRGHTLNPTALVHEAYLRLSSKLETEKTNRTDRKQFFLLAAEAMRHILIDHARYHRRKKRGGGRRREDVPLQQLPEPDKPDALAIHEALEALALERPEAADLVKLKYFAGLTLDEAAVILELSPATADRRWAFAKTWLLDRMTSLEESADS